jgi:hypothetical protein
LVTTISQKAKFAEKAPALKLDFETQLHPGLPPGLILSGFAQEPD